MIVTLFSTPTCPNCPPVKRILDEIGVQYEVVDMHSEAGAMYRGKVRAVPTVIFQSDDSVYSIVGSKPKSEYINALKSS